MQRMFHGVLTGPAVAIAFIRNDESEISWFIPIVCLLLAVPTRNAWELVMENQVES